MWSGPRPTSMPSGISIHPAIWPQHIWAENCGAVHLWGRGRCPHPIWPEQRPTCMPSFILIHPTFWPQYANVTDRQDRRRSDSIGRTVLRFYERSPKNGDHQVQHFYSVLDVKKCQNSTSGGVQSGTVRCHANSRTPFHRPTFQRSICFHY